MVAVPLRVGPGQGHIAVEGQIGFQAGVPATRRALFHKVPVKVAGSLPARQRRVVVGRHVVPVVLRLDARAAALVGAGEVVVEKDVVAQHQVSGIIQVFGQGEPALAQAEIADPALGAVVLPAVDVHAARAELSEERGVTAIIQRQEHVALAGQAAVLVHLEVQPGAAVVREAGQSRFPGGIEQAHAVVQAPLHSHIKGIEAVQRARSVAGVPTAAEVVVTPERGRAPVGIGRRKAVQTRHPGP